MCLGKSEFAGSLTPEVLQAIAEAAAEVDPEEPAISGALVAGLPPLLVAADQMFRAEVRFAACLLSLSEAEVERRADAAGEDAAEAEAAESGDDRPESGDALFLGMRVSPSAGTGTPANLASLARQEAETYNEAVLVHVVGPAGQRTASNLARLHPDPASTPGTPHGATVAMA